MSNNRAIRKQTGEDSALVSAAKVIGTTVGKIASRLGVEAPSGAPIEAHPPAKAMMKGRLAKKDKHKLPRLQKKGR
jgi:hypothetical protein